MSLRSAIPALMACLLASTLTSCISTIGDNIRNSAQLYLDADTSDRYRCGDEILVPEYSYHYHEPLITSRYYADLCTFSDVTRTGYYRVLGEGGKPGERRAGDTPGIVRENPALLPARYSPLGPTNEAEPGPWYPAAVVAAAPFDYLIDPALSIILTPPYMLLRACGLNGLVDWVHY